MFSAAALLVRWLQSGLASILREKLPEDSLRKCVLVSADVAISINAAGVSLTGTNLDDNPLLVVLSSRRMLDRKNSESAFRTTCKDLQQRLVPDVAPGLSVELVAQLVHVDKVVLVEVQWPVILKAAT